MILNNKYQFAFDVLSDTEKLSKGVWLCLLHASRIPPHVGLMINGNYNSLTIKDREMNVASVALLKTISQKKIESLFIKLVKHPVFSDEHQLNIFQEQLQQFTSVKPYEASCLSPIKLFAEEFYALPCNEEELVFDFVDRLNDNDYITEVVGLNIKEMNNENVFTFKTYNHAQLQELISLEVSSNIK